MARSSLSYVLAGPTATEPPTAFVVTASRDGYPGVTYRTTGMIGVAVFFAL
jgi:hypothetical protein